MINTTIFELLEGLKIFYRYDGDPKIKIFGQFEGAFHITSEKFQTLKERDCDQLKELRWMKTTRITWELKIR